MKEIQTTLQTKETTVQSYDIYFVNYYQSKKYKQRYKLKKLLCRAIGKCRIKTSKEALGIEVVLSNCAGGDGNG